MFVGATSLSCCRRLRLGPSSTLAAAGELIRLLQAGGVDAGGIDVSPEQVALARVGVSRSSDTPYGARAVDMPMVGRYPSY